jgi:exopolyphosphatase/guanosine-5'-triphosphate,3'-diphosphate pyrophosphatase
MEVVFGEGAFVYQRHSFPVGCLRLLDQLRLANPPARRDLARCRTRVAALLDRDVAPVVFPMLKSACGRAVTPVMVGGTARVMADLCCGLVAPDAEPGQLRDIGFNRLGTLIDRLWAMTLGERQSLRGLPSDRADTILTGSVVFHELMGCFGFARIRISLRGVRYGVLLDRPSGTGTVQEPPPLRPLVESGHRQPSTNESPP